MNHPDYYAYVDSDYDDGARRTTICLVHQSPGLAGESVAYAVFEAGALPRFVAADSVPPTVVAKFKVEAVKLSENSIPRTNLPV